MVHKLINKDNYLLVLTSPVELKIGDRYLELGSVVMLTDPSIDRTECRIIAHLPLNGSSILEGIDLLPPLEDEAVNIAEQYRGKDAIRSRHSFITGYNKAREKYRYTEKDMKKAWEEASLEILEKGEYDPSSFEKFIKSPFYPTEFECEEVTIWARNTDRNVPTSDDFDYVPKTTTNAQGQRVWVGKYKLDFKK